jgi:hypothetical protein
VAWCDYLESHARRIYGLICDPPTQAAPKLVEKIKRGDLGERFTARDVYRKDWHLLNDRASGVVEAACEILEDAGWLASVTTQSAIGYRLRARQNRVSRKPEGVFMSKWLDRLREKSAEMADQHTANTDHTHDTSVLSVHQAPVFPKNDESSERRKAGMVRCDECANLEMNAPIWRRVGAVKP